MIQKFDEFVNEGFNSAENAGLYDKMTDALDRANNLICSHEGTSPEDWQVSGPEEAIELLLDIDNQQAKDLIEEIEGLEKEIDELDAEDLLGDEDDDFPEDEDEIDIDDEDDIDIDISDDVDDDE